MISEEQIKNAGEMCFAFEYYFDAYAHPEAPFPEEKPTADKLCEYLQDMARGMAPVVAQAHRAVHASTAIKKALEELPADHPTAVKINKILETL